MRSFSISLKSDPTKDDFKEACVYRHQTILYGFCPSTD